MRTILRCNSIFSSRVSCALIAALTGSEPDAAGEGFFSAVAVGFLLTEGQWIDRNGKVFVGREGNQASIGSQIRPSRRDGVARRPLRMIQAGAAIRNNAVEG